MRHGELANLVLKAALASHPRLSTPNLHMSISIDLQEAFVSFQPSPRLTVAPSDLRPPPEFRLGASVRAPAARDVEVWTSFCAQK